MQTNTEKLRDKPSYQCEICQKTFSRPSALKTHIYIHTGERPFECTYPGCGRRFTVISNLRRHFNVHDRVRHPKRMDSNKRQSYIQQLMDKVAELQHASNECQPGGDSTSQC